MKNGLSEAVIGICPRRCADSGALYVKRGCMRYFGRYAFPVVLDMGAAEQCEAYMERMCALCDGFALIGGGDVLPELYGERGTEDCADIDVMRDLFELAVVRAAVRHAKPLLGICRGAQIMNVALGGSLGRHTDGHSNGVLHRVTLESESKLREIAGSEAEEVNSYHHQYIKTVAPGFRVSAVSADGVIEGIELKAHPFCMGVQWHPELAEDGFSDALLREFVSTARESAAKRRGTE